MAPLKKGSKVPNLWGMPRSARPAQARVRINDQVSDLPLPEVFDLPPAITPNFSPSTGPRPTGWAQEQQPLSLIRSMFRSGAVMFARAGSSRPHEKAAVDKCLVFQIDRRFTTFAETFPWKVTKDASGNYEIQ